MRLDTRNKIIRYSLIGCGIATLLFIIIFNSCWYPITGTKPEMEFTLTFAIPLLLGVLCFLSSGYFKSFTKQDAINQIEKQYRNGVISTDHYKKSLREIHMFELEKNRLKVDIQRELDKHSDELKEEIKKELEGNDNEREDY